MTVLITRTTHHPLCSLCVAFSIVINGKGDNATVMITCRLPIMVREAVTLIKKAAGELKISMKVNIDEDINWHEGARAELEVLDRAFVNPNTKQVVTVLAGDLFLVKDEVTYFAHYYRRRFIPGTVKFSVMLRLHR